MENWFDEINQVFGERPIAFYPIWARVTESVTAGLLLSQMIYWSSKSKDGWVYKTSRQWIEETALGRYEIDGARTRLRDLGIIDEVFKGSPPKIHYWVNYERLYELALPCTTAQIRGLMDVPTSGKTRCSTSGKTRSQPREKPDVQPREKPDVLLKTENTLTEITTKIPPIYSPKGECAYSEGFLKFWEKYPRRVAKGVAWKAWQRGNCEPLVDAILASVATHPQVNGEPQYIPHPSTFINQRRWEDEISPARARETRMSRAEMLRLIEEERQRETRR